MYFGSDNQTGASPQVLDMLAQANNEFTHGYGDDRWTHRAIEALKTLFECDLDAHFVASGTWHMREDLSLKMDYQYYRYSSDDWALQGVQADTIDKVLTFGARNPNEQIHYVGVSAIYRWK